MAARAPGVNGAATNAGGRASDKRRGLAV